MRGLSWKVSWQEFKIINWKIFQLKPLVRKTLNQTDKTYPDLLRISGAMYSTVPQKVKLSSSSVLSLMQPKSVSLTWPCLIQQKMSDGLS